MNIIKKPYYLLSIILLFLLSACSSNPNISPESGAVNFNIRLSRPLTAYFNAYLTGNDICTDYGIETISAAVLNSSSDIVTSGSWSCSAHEGTITDVPAGADYTIRITGTATGGTVAWLGEKSGVGVTAGEITSAGAITMDYTGNDANPPLITSSSPSIDATGVPVTTMITGIFSEKMATSSINTTTFTLKQGDSLVSGSVVYDAVTLRAVFLPSVNLTYSTTYTATLTTDIDDMAGNNMQADHTWTFTTEATPSTVPSELTGVNATGSDGQVIISWEAVAGASIYNIYWSTTSNITTTSGTKISNVTSPYVHVNRINGNTYFYVVTAVNSYGESSASSEVSAIPGLNDISPPNTSIINTPSNLTNSTAAIFTFTSSEIDSTFECRLDGNVWVVCNSPKSYTDLSDGGHTFEVRATDSGGNTDPTPSSYSWTIDTFTLWSISIIDSTENVGWGTSIAMDKNNSIHISYFDATYSRLKYATNVLGTWNTYTIDYTQGVVSNTSIAVDSNNKAHISYYDLSGNNLKYATNVLGTWVTYTKDSAGDVGWGSSIAVDDNNKVHISYFDSTNRNLKYAPDVANTWANYSIGNGGYYTAMAIDTNSSVHISYSDDTSNDLYYATNISGTWVTYPIDSAGYVGWDNSIALDANNNVHISYYDFTNDDLKYATNISGLWSTYVIDRGGRFTSTAVDSANKVHISYYDVINRDLKYATNASGIWVTYTIDSMGDVGSWSSIAIDNDNKVHISYFDVTNGDLKYVTNASSP